jgi:predicted phosphoribosyltransferase
MKFKDRLFAGYLLSEALKDNNKMKKLNFNKLIVLGIPRGGVIVADVIAVELRINNGIIIPKKKYSP